MPEQNKRRKILVDPQFQVRLAFWASILAAVEVMVGSVAVMAVALTSIWVPVARESGFFYKFVGVIALVVLGATAVNFMIALLVSHKIAGPVYRLKKSMEQVSAGDLSLLIKLREGDELQELKDSFNEMVNSLRQRAVRLRAHPAFRRLGEKAGKSGEWPFKTD